jgi:ferredoxin-NADP reductase
MNRAIRIERPPEITVVASQATRLILGGDLARPMTIASGPARPYLDFAVQRTASDFERAFFGIAPGDTVQITAARGHFLLDRERPAEMIASGIGATAFNLL